MGETLGGGQIFWFPSQFIGIEKGLVNTAVLGIQHTLHLIIAEGGGDEDTPVAEFQENGAGCRVVAVDVGIAQSGQNLVLHVPRYGARPRSGKAYVLRTV